MEDPAWKKTTLSLERPYQDDNGDPIPVLLDITPEGDQVFEPPSKPLQILGQNLRRIFVERGVDFFERQDELPLARDSLVPQRREASQLLSEETENVLELTKLSISSEELFKMRVECIPQLYIALGEMTQARDLVSSLLSSTSPSQTPNPSLPSSALTATTVTQPQVITSLAAFNAQLTIGGKDEALRRAAKVFKQAVSKLERGYLDGEKYWADALRIRRGNWGLTPAPLPFGASVGKGTDKTSKDFLISFGLEEAPVQFRRRAAARLATYKHEPDVLAFPHRSWTRLQVSLITTNRSGDLYKAHNSAVRAQPERTSLESSLKIAQRETVDEELFSVLIKEANNLPTVSVRIAERLIVIDVAQGTELQFEMVGIDEIVPPATDKSEVLSATCDLIYHMLQALLLSSHDGRKSQRIGIISQPQHLASPVRSDLLQPIVDLLQFQHFCDRIKAELDKMISSLQRASVPCTLRFDPVGEAGENLRLRLSANYAFNAIGGEALLRIYDRQTLRLTFSSPSSLTAHLPQATLPIASMPQLSQLLFDEVEKCLLGRLCEAGNHHCERVGGTWFVDTISGKTVGRWEGCVLKFCIAFAQNSDIYCSAYRLERGSGDRHTFIDSYSPQNSLSLIAWQQDVLERILRE